eukprot:COSAG06_NODE_4096_length_4579_cov_2.390625_3_plen_61_part_00
MLRIILWGLQSAAAAGRHVGMPSPRPWRLDQAVAAATVPLLELLVVEGCSGCLRVVITPC